jgi:type IV pilus assembly protein PilO
MTYSEDLMNTTQLDNTTYLADAPNHPVFFGISLSPIFFGGIMAVIGIGAAGYFGFTTVMPKMEANKEQQAKLDDIQQQIKDRKNNAIKIAEAEEKLKALGAQKEVVLSLFANDKKLDTFLLDLNKLVNERQGELQKFVPDIGGSGTIADGMMGAALNGKLRRKSTEIAMTGNFDQVLSILRTVERMDRFLILRDFKADLIPAAANTGTGNNVGVTPKLRTGFKLQAIIPLTAAETPPAPPAPAPAAPAPAPAPAKK